jgi:hypothetical protein
MLKDFFLFFQHVLTVAKEHERLQKNIERLERTQVEHGLLLQRLADQIVMNQRHEQDAREKIALQLQIEMLKFEKRLPPAA